MFKFQFHYTRISSDLGRDILLAYNRDQQVQQLIKFWWEIWLEIEGDNWTHQRMNYFSVEVTFILIHVLNLSH